jgi:hypothetical protein
LAHPIEAVVSTRTTLTAAEADAIIGLAHVAIGADGETNDEEMAAFRAVVIKLRSVVGVDQGPYRAAIAGACPLSHADHLELLDRLAAESEHVSTDERIRALAERLERQDCRSLAYRVVYALGISDFAVHRSEEAVERSLAAALGFDEARVAAIVDDVNRVLTLES